MSKQQKFPFIFLNHGKPIDIYSFQGEKYFVFGFKENITSETAEIIESMVPEVLSGSVIHAGCLLMLYNISDEDDITGYYLAKRGSNFKDEFDDKLFMNLYTDLANDIESWAVKANNEWPVDFFIGHSRIKGSKWDKYSEEHLEYVIEKLINAAEENSPQKNKIINQALHIIIESKNKLISANMKKQIKMIIDKTK